MVDDLCPTKGGDMLRMVDDPWTIVCLSIKVIAQLRLIYNDEIHFCFYIERLEAKIIKQANTFNLKVFYDL